MADINIQDYATNAAQAVRSYRSNTNPYWSDSYLNMGAQLAQQAMENDYNLKLWNMNNEYNSPQAQMERFKAAGLNPNLMYTQGTPGNSNSPASASHASYQLSPQKDRLTQIDQIGSLVGMVTNLANNVSNMVSQGYDTAMKRNELAWSNTELAAAKSNIFGFGDRNADPKYRMVDVEAPDGSIQTHIPSTLNPYSINFSPLEYNTLYRLGKIPNFFTGQLTGQASSRLNQFRGDYQDYYNREILPLFSEYQQGKINIQDVTHRLLNYNVEAMEALPPEVRGVMQPIMALMAMFLKFL